MNIACARYYEDLVVGESRISGPVVVEPAEMLAFARMYDPQYFHADPEEATRRSIFGEAVASGIYTMALWRRLDHTISGDIAWICGVAWEEVRWPVAVRAGDSLRARTEVLSKRESATQAGRGVVECRYALLNQRDEVAFTCRSVNLIECRTAPPGRGQTTEGTHRM
jgi:acyl dehydratase